MKLISSAAALLLLFCCSVQATALDGASGFSMRADALAKAFDENELTAEAKFKGKQISLGGTVVRVGKDQSLGLPYVILKGSGTMNVKCVFPSSELGRIGQLKPNTLTAISGTVQGKPYEHSQDVIVQNCRM